MLKIKHQRTADCVVAGFRWHKNGPGTHVGSLLLGLFDEEGTLHHVGITSSFTWDRRAALVEELAPLRERALEGSSLAGLGRVGAAGVADASGQRVPGATSRWNRGKDLSWEPLRAERVAEVAYDHLQGTRFRHATTFKRWRPDKPPEACRYDQLEVTAPFLLSSNLRILIAGLRGPIPAWSVSGHWIGPGSRRCCNNRPLPARPATANASAIGASADADEIGRCTPARAGIVRARSSWRPTESLAERRPGSRLGAGSPTPAGRTFERAGAVRPVVSGPRVVVDLERLLGRPIRLGDVDQVDANAGPGRGPAAH